MKTRTMIVRVYASMLAVSRALPQCVYSLVIADCTRSSADCQSWQSR